MRVAARRCRRGSAGEGVDLVTIGYVLNELDAAAASRAVERAWAATVGALAVAAAGTPGGYRRILDGSRAAARPRRPCRSSLPARPALPARGGGTGAISPCACPRSSGHRAAKAAQAGFEDEKFAYVVVTREPVGRAPARILRHPQVRGGHVRLELCAADGLRSVVVSKRDRNAFREARKASWGDAFGDAVDDTP